MPGIVVGIDVSEFNKKLSAAQQAVNGLSSVLKVVPREAQSAGSALSDTGKNAQNAAGNIKSLAKQLLGLVGAYKAVDSAMNFAKRGVEFNSSIESSRIGIASIINSMATLQNSQGQVLEGAEKYAAAQEVAAQMMKRIQILGLETTATTQDLVQGVQSVIGPALQAGMRLEQIPDFAVAAAQAMQTMGIPLQQMRTELDALLTGRVNLAQDLLAPRLFSDKGAKAGEYIQQLAKEGKLLDEIMRRLDAFRVAGADVAQTFTGMMSNLDEALDVVSGKVSLGLTGKLKEAIGAMQELFVSTKNGSTGISSDFEHIADLLTEIETGIGEGILTAIRGMIAGTKEFNEYIGKNGAANALDDLTIAAKTAAASFVALKVARAAYNSETLSNLKKESESIGVIQTLREHIINLDGSLKKRIATEHDAAQAALQTAQASFSAAQAEERRLVVENDAAQSRELAARVALTEARNKKELAVSSRQVLQAEQLEIAALREYSAATKIATQSQQQLAIARAESAKASTALSQATTKMSTAAKGASSLAVGLSGLKSAFSGIISILGGPWGAAFTVGIGALGYFISQEDSATEYAKNHAESMRMVSSNTQDASAAIAEYTKKLFAMTEQEREQLRLRQESERKELTQGKWFERTLASRLSSPLLSWLPSVEEREKIKSLTDIFLPENFGKATSDELKTAKQAYIEYANSIGIVVDKQAAQIDSAIAAKISQENLAASTELLKSPVVAIGLSVVETANKFGILAQAVTQAGNAMDIFKNQASAATPLQELLKESEWANYTSSLSAVDSQIANALKGKKYDQEQIKKMLGGTFDNEADKKALEAARKNFQSASDRRSATKGASQTATAQEGIKKLREEIDRLNGTSVQAVTSLDQKLREIEKTGKEAGLSAQGIADLRNEYQDAFKANTLKDFNKEILQLQGNTSALREIEIGDTVKEWGQKLTAAGLESDEVTAKTEELKAALEKQWNTKNLQVTADFYKQLAEYSGDFNLSMEYQNRLIEIQGQNWIQNGIAMQDVVKMQELMRQEAARDPWSGMLRGMRKWSGEATNLGKQVETSLTSAFDNASDALADFVTTGKLNFADLANSIISDLARIAARQAIGGIVGGLASGLGNLFGGSYTDTAKNMVNYIPGVNFSAKGNVFSGGNISDYSNSIVSRPTLFSYGSQLQPFARGAGLMGEAGREAILPLARTSTGNLGVYATFEQRQTQRDLDRLKASMNTVEAIVLSHKAQREAATVPAPEVKVNIINNSNAQVTQETRTDNYGNKTIDVMVGDAAARQLNRPGTTLNKSLYQQTGLQRRAIRR